MTSPDWTYLPREASLHIFSFLGSTLDLGACAAVCRSFRAVADEPELWQQIALDKYGPVCANFGYRNEYNRSWRALLRDDNKRAALPTIHLNKPCFWRYNRNHGLFYCCFVAQVKWDRVNDQVKIYLDARGESDLRLPNTSTIFLRDRAVEVTLDGHFVPEVLATQGHYKGFLHFSAEQFKRFFSSVAEGARLSFCYANRDHIRGDYFSIEFPSWDEISNSQTYSTNESPFANDNEDIERTRWDPLVPQAILDRRQAPGRRFNATWWV